MTDPTAEPDRPQWQITIEVPLDLPVDQRHELFSAIGEAVGAWEPMDRDGWDAIVCGQPAPAAVRDTEMEQLRGELDQFIDFSGEQSNRVRELEAEMEQLRAQRDQYRKLWRDQTNALTTAARDERDAARAELAGLRERAIILTKRVRYVYDDVTWDGWLVTLTAAATGTQATVRRDNGEDWVVMARNIIEIPAPEPATLGVELMRHGIEQSQASRRKQCAWWYDTKQCPDWNQDDSDYCRHHTETRIQVYGTKFARRANYTGETDA